MARRKLLFVATEDWFFASHFLPMARAAGEMGFDVAVIARERQHRRVIEAAGARLIALEAERRSLSPTALYRQVMALKHLIAAEQPDILHCIALKPIALAGFAGKIAGVERRVYALTGLGFLGAREGAVAQAARLAARFWLREAIDGPHVRFLFENPDDPVMLGLDPADATKVAIVGGAGVDPLILMPEPMLPQPPLKVAVVARMLWSKGADLAVEAVTLARKQGARIELTLHGAPDPSNPQGGAGSDLARMVVAPRHQMGRADARHRGCLARPSCLLPAFARRRGPAAHLARRRRLRPGALDHRRAGLPQLRARRPGRFRRPGQ